MTFLFNMFAFIGVIAVLLFVSFMLYVLIIKYYPDKETSIYNAVRGYLENEERNKTRKTRRNKERKTK